MRFWILRSEDLDPDIEMVLVIGRRLMMVLLAL
jgi:hypothetical protein